MPNEFVGYPKIARLAREMIVTEKLDGTNAQIFITFDPADVQDKHPGIYPAAIALSEVGHMYIFTGSRNRWITPHDDNFGFAKWVAENASELSKLGPGRHFGEWYGRGIQRGYGLDERRFALFNTSRWNDDLTRPRCCSVVPVVMTGVFDTALIDRCVDDLRHNGSFAVPGYMDPEGVVVFHVASGALFKKTLKDDESPKTATK
jgi:hypothetical protein